MGTFSYFICFEANQLTFSFNPIYRFLTEQLGQVQDFYDDRYACHVIRSLVTASFCLHVLQSRGLQTWDMTRNF